MKLEFVPPKLIQYAFRHFHWHTSNNKILLTFDDGPNPFTTEKILHILNEIKVKSIFFCVGNNVLKYPELVKEILHQGHLIGNHTYNHSVITKINRNDLSKELEMFNFMLADQFAHKVFYFRPPRGRFFVKANSFLKGFNLQNVMWSLLTYDYKNDLNIVKFGVKNYLRDNSIVVLHDSLKSKDIINESLRFVIDEAYKKDYKFGEPLECLK